MPKPCSPLISFYDRSWYSRPLIQSVNGWCTENQRSNFMRDVATFEERHDETVIIKFWLSISQDEQNRRLSDRKTSLLRGWKYSDNDAKALSSYDKMTLAKEALFTAEGQDWSVVDYNSKKKGRLELITRLNDIIMTQFGIDDYDLH